MNITIGILIVIFNCVLTWINKDKGILFYIICSIILPVIHIRHVQISYEIISFAFIFIIFILKTKCIIFNKKCFILLIYLGVYVLATLQIIIRFGIAVNLIAIVGMVRMVLLYTILINCHSLKCKLLPVMGVCLLVNFFCMIIQYTNPASIDLFISMYGKDSALALNGIKEAGYQRLTGTFNNAAPSGIFFLYCFSLYFDNWRRTGKIKNAFTCLLSILCGLATASKTFIVGIILVTVVTLFFYILSSKKKFVLGKKTIKILFVACFILVFVVMFVFAISEKLDTVYYLKNLDINTIFGSRFNAETGLLADTIGVIFKYPILGIGATNIAGEFVGDSLYIVTLHDTGILGMIILSIFMMMLCISNIKVKNTLNLSIALVIVFCGIGSPTIFNVIGISMIAFITPQVKLRFDMQKQRGMQDN